MAQIGTIRLQTQNNGTVSVPVFNTGDSDSSVYEIYRVETAGGTGFIPLADTADAAYPYLRVQTQNLGTLAVHDDSTTEIPLNSVPASASHRWAMNDGSGTTVTDVINGANLSTGGAIWISGSQYQGGFALERDNASDAVDGSGLTTNVGFDGPFTLAMTYKADANYNNNAGFASPNGMNSALPFDSGFGSQNNVVNFLINNNAGDRNRIDGEITVTDNVLHRIVVVVPDSTDPSTWEIWVDNTQDSTSITANQFSTVDSGDNTFDFVRWGESNDGTGQEMDDCILYDTALNSSEIAQDYNAQPWT